MATKSKLDAAPPKEKIRFFHGLAPMRSHIAGFKHKYDSEGDPIVTLSLRMTLNGNVIRSAPTFVKVAYDGIENSGQDYISFKEIVEGVHIEIHETEKSKGVAQSLSEVTLKRLELKEIKSSQSDPSIVLTFDVDYPADADLWRYLRTHSGRDCAFVFDAAQATLLSMDDEEEKRGDANQGSLPMPSDVATDGKSAAAGS